MLLTHDSLDNAAGIQYFFFISCIVHIIDDSRVQEFVVFFERRVVSENYMNQNTPRKYPKKEKPDFESGSVLRIENNRKL